MRAGGQTARLLHLSVDGNDAAHRPIQGMQPRNEAWHRTFVHPGVGNDHIGVLLGSFLMVVRAEWFVWPFILLKTLVDVGMMVEAGRRIKK